jgi:6,7-dimethyl-8-ribityllumazine synthase
MSVFEGTLTAPPKKIGIVVSRYNETVTGKLLRGALEVFAKAGVDEKQIDTAWVPGAFELPPIAAVMAESGKYSAVLVFGAVIRGETTHDQHINRAVSMSIMETGVRTRVPVLFGLLTCDTLEQALQRAGGTMGNKGSECAEAALRMASLIKALS